MDDEIPDLVYEAAALNIPDEIAELLLDKERLSSLRRGDLEPVIEALRTGNLSPRLQPHLAALLTNDASQDYRIEIKPCKGISWKQTRKFKEEEVKRNTEIGYYVAYFVQYGMMRKDAIAKAAIQYSVSKEKARRCYSYFKSNISVIEDGSVIHLNDKKVRDFLSEHGDPSSWRS